MTAIAPVDQPVIVVGAGPVGLTAAYVLARSGVRILVLEAGEVPSIEWRASTFHPPTLELYDTVDLSDDMLSAGLIARHFQMRDRQGGLFAEFDLDILANDTRFPFRLQYEQYKLVRLIQSRLAELPNAEIRFGHRVVGVDQSRDRANVHVEHAGRRSTLGGAFLLGADGASSAVRKSLGIGFPGLTYEDRFLLLSTTFPFEQHLPGIRHVNYIADPEEYMMLLRIPDVWRVLFSVRPGEEEKALTPAEGERRLQRVVASDAPYEVVQRQIYRVHQRVAERMQVGRVFLLGDAAHVNSPFGGMGLNSGVHDAFDLARRLERVLVHDGDLEGLEAYGHRRRDIAVNHVQAQTHRNTNELAERDPALRRRNQAAMAAIADDPVRAREWLLDAAMLRQVREQGIGDEKSIGVGHS